MTKRQDAYQEARTKTLSNIIRVIQATDHDRGFNNYELGHIDALVEKARQKEADLEEMSAECRRLEAQVEALRPFQPPVDANHALLVGALAMSASMMSKAGLPYTVSVPKDAEDAYLSTIVVTSPSGGYLVTVVKGADEEEWIRRYEATGLPDA